MSGKFLKIEIFSIFFNRSSNRYTKGEKNIVIYYQLSPINVAELTN
jgi:hypothetical protein